MGKVIYGNVNENSRTLAPKEEIGIGKSNGYVAKTTPYVPSYDNGNNNSGSTSSSSSDSYNGILEAYKTQLANARNSYLAEIESRLNATRQAYEGEMDNAKQYYQNNRNASEVQRYKSRKSLREALANRGQLDSGYGRQETLDMNLNYDNALNTINNQEASTLTQIKNLITQAQADAEKEKAQVNQNYSNSLLSLLNLG